MGSNIQTTFKKLEIDKWVKVDLKGKKDFYLIGIKNKKSKKDLIDPAKIKKIKFEIALETGLKDKYITTSYIYLNFDDISSSNSEINSITGYTKYINGPSKFYIKAIEVVDDSSICYKEGKVNISININPQTLS